MYVLHLLLIYVVIVNAEVTTEEYELTDQSCYTREVEVTPTRVSHYTPQTVLSTQWCWSWPFRCEVENTIWTTTYKIENITRVVNKPACCPGYTGEVDACTPICSFACVHGTCTAPEICTCEVGYSGPTCEEIGCPPGKWGQGCVNSCTCDPGSTCDSLNGTCICPPGYEGTNCTQKCTADRFGPGCTGSCNCTVGTFCHHITGECLSCTHGMYGEGCSEQCTCAVNGTALCSHVDGRCFCEGNFFGSKCELHCPFGLVNETCLKGPSKFGCECPNDLFICDPTRGCLCPPGSDCGIEQLVQAEVGFLGIVHKHNGIIIAVSTVLGIGMVLMILLIIYYKRRINNLKSEFQNSSMGNIINQQSQPVDLRNLEVPRREEPLSGVDNPIYACTEMIKNTNIDLASTKEDSKQNKCMDAELDEGVYNEPKELLNCWSLMNDFQEKYGKNVDDSDCYDTLEFKRAPNDDVTKNQANQNVNFNNQ